jgi:hypothetical protein
MTSSAQNRGHGLNRSGKISTSTSSFRDREFTDPDASVSERLRAPMFGDIYVITPTAVDPKRELRARALKGSATQLWRDLKDDRADLDVHLAQLSAASRESRSRLNFGGRSRDRRANEAAVAAEWRNQQIIRQQEERSRNLYIAGAEYETRNDRHADNLEERGFFTLAASGYAGERTHTPAPWTSRRRLADPLRNR